MDPAASSTSDWQTFITILNNSTFVISGKKEIKKRKSKNTDQENRSQVRKTKMHWKKKPGITLNLFCITFV